MSVNLSPLGGAGAQFFTNDGVPLTGGLLYTYLAGTSTPATTYTSSSGVTALANPIILDAAGRVPTGEIWLSDGISYKFVLKDSTDVLIATWDNLSGINSNFISYTAQEETATATAGQTVFNLAIDYIVNANSLAVFVNGSNQIVGVNYVETDTNTVTFLTGLNVGDIVKFSTATPVATNAVDASNVSYTPPGTGAVTTDVQTKLRESVSPEDFGAVGDGVTDDGPAFVLACNYCSLNGATLRLSPKVYKNGRIEVHGTYCVEGNGATVMYLGVGQTIVAGTGTGTAAVPTPWGTDPGYQPSYPATTQYTLAVAPSAGATSITLTSASGITVGMNLFICGNPSSLSSTNNFIPRDFEFIQVVDIVGTVLTLGAPLQSAYLTTQSGVFYAPGLAYNCHVSGLNINTTTDAYQQVVRSSLGCTIKDITFSGTNAVGASTFSDGLVYENMLVMGTGGGGFSTARGTVSTVFNNVNMKNYTVLNAFFCEESFYKVTLNNFFASGAFAAGSMDCSSSQRTRLLTINNSMFNPSMYGDLRAPFSVGTFTGADINVSNTIFQGAVTTPNPSNYPSITGNALIWISSNAATDTVTFANCQFISSNAGNTWPSAIGGFLGTLQFDNLSSYVTCTAPARFINLYNTTSTWVPTISGLTTAGTQTYTTQVGNYNRTGNLVTIQFAVAWSASSGTGDIVLAGLPFNTNATSNGVFTVWDGTLTIAAASAGQFSAGNPRIVISKSAAGAGSIYGTVSYFI